MQININEWEASVKSKAHFSSAKINNRFFMLNLDIEKISKQALIAAVSVSIQRDITNLSDTLLRTKRLGLRNVSSQIDVANPRSEIRADLHQLSRTNFPNTGIPVNRILRDTEVQKQTLNGSETNFDCPFEGGNLKMSLLQIDNAFEVRSQNFCGSESSIDSSYRRENPQPLTLMGLQDRIVEVHNNPHYGSDSNINYDEGRISESLESSTWVGSQNVSYGPGPSAGSNCNLKIQDIGVGNQTVCGTRPSIGIEYRVSNLDIRVRDQNLYGHGSCISYADIMMELNARVRNQELVGSGPSIELYGISARDTRVGDQTLSGPGPDISNSIALDHLNPRVMDLESRGAKSIITNENIGVGSRSESNP